ncbi:MAG TPA: hypothetical protein VJT67_16865 [Longimicrobiaceae bacterium]|nr:hypothetical protein [Longimicrobiaceae bacterium]
MAFDKTQACGEEHPPFTSNTGCEEDTVLITVPVENPFGTF